MPSISPEIQELAAAYGVATEYWDQAGQHHEVSFETLIAVLAAAGADVKNGVAAELERVRLDNWRRVLPPVVVTKEGDTPWVWVHIPDGTPIRGWIRLEEGGERHDIGQADRWVEPVRINGTLVGEATLVIPGDIPLGWHTLSVDVAGDTYSTTLVVTPRALQMPERLKNDRIWGFMTQLYSMRSSRSWGLGDLADLGELAAWSAHSLGADYVLINPLHAASPLPPMAPSPYLPVARRFANPIYLRIEDIPEYAYMSEVARMRIEILSGGVKRLNKTAALLDRDAVWAAKLASLEAIFQVPLTAGRQAAFETFIKREGEGLFQFATWCVIAEKFEGKEWPEEFLTPSSAEVAQFRAENVARVQFYCWMQWLLDEQLAKAQSTALAAGMACGIVHDLAVGVHPTGADSWALQDVLARGVSVGAPPDMYNQMGQDWSQPPWRPQALREAAYIPYRDMLRTILRHAGGIRVDHILGLFRLWWVPQGQSAAEGTFVRYDHEALVGILCLEAQRAGAFVIGEDLGTVEQWVQDYLLERGIMGTSILWFERNPDVSIKKPRQWREFALGSVTVHDLPPTAGYIAGAHVTLRSELGILTVPVEEERAAHKAEMKEWEDMFGALGILRPHASEQELVETYYRFLASTPTRVLGVALPDAVGDQRSQNQPGTFLEYPNWRIPLCDAEGQPVLLDDLPKNARLNSLVRAMGMAGPGRATVR